MKQKKASIELEAVSTTISFINTVHTISAFQFPIHSFTHSLCFFRNYFSPNEITQSFICGGSYLKAFFHHFFYLCLADSGGKIKTNHTNKPLVLLIHHPRLYSVILPFPSLIVTPTAIKHNTRVSC